MVYDVTQAVFHTAILDMTDHLHISSPSPAASLGSDAMSDPSPGSPAGAASPADNEVSYPLEGKFRDAADREEIMAMPEIERESILAERAAEATRKKQDLALKQMLEFSKAQTSKHKRKAGAAELDDESRKTSRPKTEKTGRSALDNYKKAREAKGAERTGRLDTKRDRRRSSRSRSSASDRDADGESEVEWAESTPARRDEPPAELKDFERCRVGRSQFAKFLFYPNFEDTIKGCYCRVSIGMNRETGQNTYRMTQIKGFTEGKPYLLEAGPNAKSFMCDQYAIVAHGVSEKPWPFSACSDSKLSPDEYTRYIDTLQKERVRVPKKAHLTQKLDDIHRFLNPDWTETVLQTKFAKQRAMEKRLDPANIAKAKHEAILKRKADAEETNDEEELARCDAELAALENTANGSLAKQVIRSPAKPAQVSQQDKLALLNQKNRGRNSEDVRKALIEERRKIFKERERMAAEKRAKEAEAKAEAERKNLLGVPGPDMKELFGDLSDASRAGTPMSGVSTPKLRRSRQGTPAAAVVKSKLGKVVDDGDEMAGLDLGIDVEI